MNDPKTSFTLSRRDLLIATAAVVGSAASGGVISARAQDSLVRFATYGGSWRDAIDKYIGAEMRTRGFDVSYVLDNPAGNIAKLVAARGRAIPYDCLESSPQHLNALIKEGFIEKLDLSRIPNTRLLPSLARSEYSIMTLSTLYGIVYNAERFNELGIDPPQHHIDLANPKLAGRVSLPDISHTLHYLSVIGLSYDAGGDEHSLEKAIPLIKRINPAYFYSSSTDLANKFGAGEIWAAPWVAGWALRLRRDGLPTSVSYVHTGDKYRAIMPVLYHIISGGANVAGAEQFADLYVSSDVQFQLSKATGYLPMNLEARNRMKDDAEGRDFYLSDADIENAYIIDFPSIDTRRWRDVWSRVVHG